MDASEHLPGCDLKDKPRQPCSSAILPSNGNGTDSFTKSSLGCAVVPLTLIGALALVAIIVVAILPFNDGEPEIIVKVEPPGVRRVFVTTVPFGGSGADTTLTNVYYTGNAPYGTILRHYDREMTQNGYQKRQSRGGYDGVLFDKGIDTRTCLTIEPYVRGSMVSGLSERQAGELEQLQNVFVVAYATEHHLLSDETGC